MVSRTETKVEIRGNSGLTGVQGEMQEENAYIAISWHYKWDSDSNQVNIRRINAPETWKNGN